MDRLMIFGGTTEGRLITRFCDDNNISALVCVATEYGGELLSQSDNITIHTGRLNADDITLKLASERFSAVIDATHPYAKEVSVNIKLACDNTNTCYIRLKREETLFDCDTPYMFDNIDKVISYLNSNSKKALITTGSKDIESYTHVNSFANRLVLRILPSAEMIDKCLSLGFDKENIITEKGPFTIEENIAHIKKYNVTSLIT